MSVATGLLLAGAVGIMLVMHFVGRGGHENAHDSHEVQGTEIISTHERGDGAKDKERPAHRGHGCC